MHRLFFLPCLINSRGTLSSFPLPTWTALALAAVTTVAFRRATGHALCVAVTPASTVVADSAARVAPVVELVPTTARVSARAIQSLPLVFPVPAVAVVVAERAGAPLPIPVAVALTLTVPLPVAIPVAITLLPPLLHWGQSSTDFAVGSFAIRLGLAAVCLVSVWFWGTTEAARWPPSFAAMRAMVAVAAIIIPAAAAVSVTRLALALAIGIFVLLPKTTKDLVKGGLSEFVGFEGFVFLVLFHARPHRLPSVRGSDRRVQPLDPGTQGVNRTALVPVGRVLFLLASPSRLLLNALEQQVEDFGVNVRCSPICSNNLVELLKRGLGSDLIAFVLGKMIRKVQAQ